MVDLGVAWVTVAAETSGISKRIAKELSHSEKIAGASGKRMGAALSEGIASAQSANVDSLRNKLVENEKKLAAATEMAARRRKNAIAQVEIAEQKLAEVRAKGATPTSQVLKAEAQLEKVRANSKSTAGDIKAAEARVAEARKASQAKASEVSAAEDKVARARQKLADVSRSGVGEIAKFSREVSDSKKALRDAEAETKKFSNSVGKLSFGDRFKHSFSGLRKTFSDAFKGASDEADKAGKASGSRFSESFKGAIGGIGVYFGATELIGGIKEAVTKAGDLEQSVGAIDTVFKGSAGQMHAWAQEAKTSVGLSENAYNEFATVLGAKLKNAGMPFDEISGKTNELIVLGADLASMFGGTTADAIDAISAALNGEMDPMERYGVSLNDAALTQEGLAMGIEKTGGAFTDQQKKLITMSLLTKQTADAQGNFNREQDTYAHKVQVASAAWEDLTAKMGERFLPVMTNIFGWIADKGIPALAEFSGGITAFKNAWVYADGDITSSGFAGEMEKLAWFLRQGYDWMTKWFPVWAPFAAAVSAAVGTFVAFRAALAAVSIAQGIQTGIMTAWAVATGVQEGALLGLAAAEWAALAPIALIVAAVAGLAAGFYMAYTRIGWFKDAVNTAWAGISSTTGAFVGWWTQTAWPAIAAGVQAIGGWFVALYRSYVSPAFSWIGSVIGGFLNWWNTSFVPGLSGAIQALGGFFTWLYVSVVTPVFRGILGVVTMAAAVFLTVFQGIAWAIQNTVGRMFMWLWHSVVSPVFTWIGAKIAGFSAWFQNTAVPVIRFAIELVAAKWRDLWNTVSTVWSWIGSKISSTWAWIRDAILVPLGNFLRVYVGAAFHWLGQKVSDVWHWIATRISDSWAWIRDFVLFPLVRFLDGTVGEGFRKLWRTVSTIWGWISDKISDSWAWIKGNVLSPMGDYLTKNVVDFFQKTKDGIGRVWDGIKDVVKTPVRFVIDTVINDGLIKNYNNLNDFWSGKDLATVKLPKGFATGGYTGRGGTYEPAGIVHRDEFVIRKKARRKFERENPGLLDQINRTGSLKGSNPGGAKNAKRGAAAGWFGGESFLNGLPPSGPSGIWGALQNSMASAGAVSFPKASVGGASTVRAAQAWMGRSALNVNVDGKGPRIGVSMGGPGPWGFTSGSQVTVHPNSPSNMRLPVLMHEFGHVLSLHHTNSTGSLMHPSIAGPKQPSALDYRALVKAWGKPGAGVKTYNVNGGDGGGSLISDLIREKIADVIKAPIKFARDKFSGNGFVEMPLGIAEKMVDDLLSWGDTQDGGGSSGGDWTSTVKEALKRTGLPVRDDYVSAWNRQIQSESGGNPRAVQGGYTDVNTLSGDLAQGLVQVIGSTFAAYRDKSLPNDRFHPLANLVAAMNYAKARYGSSGLLGVIGHGHGYSGGGRVRGDSGFASATQALVPALYDNGGKIEGKGLRLIDHQRSTPDYVLTEKEWNAMFTIAKSQEGSNNGGGVQIGSVHGYTAEEVATQIEIKRRKRQALYMH